MPFSWLVGGTQNDMTQPIFVQVGVTAMRELNGKHKPSVPLYIQVTHLTKAGLTDLETQKIPNFSGFFAKKRKEQEQKRKQNKGELKNEQSISG